MQICNLYAEAAKIQLIANGDKVSDFFMKYSEVVFTFSLERKVFVFLPALPFHRPILQ